MTSPPSQNPFQHPSFVAPGGDPTLSPNERKIYEFIHRYQSFPPPFMDLVIRHVGQWIVLIVSTALGIAIFFGLDSLFGGPPDPATSQVRFYIVAVMAGMAIGSILRDVTRIRQTQKLWMIEMRVIDFPLIERLLWGAPDAKPVARDDEEPLAAIPVDDQPPHVR